MTILSAAVFFFFGVIAFSDATRFVSDDGVTTGFWYLAVRLAMGIILIGFAACQVGLALRSPVLLRIDDKGISGYGIPPLTWDEIAVIDVFQGSGKLKRQNYLGFTVFNPEGLNARTTWMQRLGARHRTRGAYHIALAEAGMDGSVKYLRDKARAFRSEATAGKVIEDQKAGSDD